MKRSDSSVNVFHVIAFLFSLFLSYSLLGGPLLANFLIFGGVHKARIILTKK